MNACALALWVSAFGSFSWGALCFFARQSGFRWPTGLVAALGLGFGVWHAVAIATTRACWGWRAAGAACCAGSAVLFWSAVRACRSRGLTAISERDIPVCVVRTGPYRYVRHPFYTSYTLFWFGGALGSLSLLALASAVVMLGVYLWAIAKEEGKFAVSPVAEEYRAYRQVTGRMCPMVGKRRASGRG